MSDNIYCVKNYFDDFRVSIDTLYLGFKCDSMIGENIYYKINNKLSCNCIKLCPAKRGNIYYKYVETDNNNGVYLSMEPREGLYNDFITLQLSGKFFRDIENSEKFIDYLFDEFSEYIRIQRIDIAIDILYGEYPVMLQQSKEIYMCGFPIPAYNEDYHYKKVGFELYGRSGQIFSDNMFVNMIASGKGDNRLRVYDKSLDLMEKYKTEYSLYYDIAKDYEQVYRIELQSRGKKLKGFIDTYLGKYERYERKTLIDEFLNYIFQKYSFKYVDGSKIVKEFREPIRFIPLIKKQTKIDRMKKQYKYHANMQNSHFRKCCDLADKIVIEQKAIDACKAMNLFYNTDVNKFDMYALFMKEKMTVRQE